MVCPTRPLSSLKKMTAYIPTHKHQYSHPVFHNRNLAGKKNHKQTKNPPKNPTPTKTQPFPLPVVSSFYFLSIAYATLISTARCIYVQPTYCCTHLEAEIYHWYCRRDHFGLFFQKDICSFFLLFVIKQSFVICQSLSFLLYLDDFSAFPFFTCVVINNKQKLYLL